MTARPGPIASAYKAFFHPEADSLTGREQVSQRDHYDVLGVDRSASADEIRRAYRKPARRYHPEAKADDPQAQQRFAEITEAHEVLGDPDRRKKYDQFGHQWNRVPDGAAAGNPFNGFTGAFRSGSGGFSMEDLLGGIFGGRSEPTRGEDVRTTIQVPFQVGVEGGEHELTVRAGGRTDRLSFRIPPGIESGKTIRLAGQGHAGPRGGPPGDLLVTVDVMPHPFFRRDGFNLILDAPVTMTEAALGAKIEVPTLSEGPVILTVPPGTSSGAKLRLRGKGVLNRATGQRGDQIVVIQIRVPRDLSAEAREALKQFDEHARLNPRDGLW